MKIRHECEFEWEHRFDTEEECRKHELEDCPQNPKIKSCTTCKYQTDDCNGNKVYYSCKKDVIKTSPIAYKKNCESWEWDEGYSHA